MNDELDWKRFNAVIAIRHAIPELLEKNMKILQMLPYQTVVFKDFAADDYITAILTRFNDTHDWVINVDDDCFLTDFKALYDLMAYMDDHEYDLCGTPDGLTYTPRDVSNAASMNPFFNVFRIKSLKHKCPTQKIAYRPDLIKHIDLSKFHPEIHGKTVETLDGTEWLHVFQEAYFPVFWALLQNAKNLHLYARSYDDNKQGIVLPDDSTSTVLYNHENVPICYHTWFARYYNIPQDLILSDCGSVAENKKRIDKVIEKAFRIHHLL